MDYGKLNELVEELEGVITDEETFDFLMVALEEKPGGLVMDPSESAIEELEDVMEEAGVEYLQIGEVDRGLLDRLLGREELFSTVGFFFAKERSHFEVLEESEGEFYGCSTSAVGEFLGYPEESVDYYGKSSEIGRDTIRDIKEKYPEPELEYLALVGYIPAPNREEVKEAVEKGKERARLVEELADQGLPRGRELKDKLIAESHWQSS